jgi:hypothetical protein
MNAEATAAKAKQFKKWMKFRSQWCSAEGDENEYDTRVPIFIYLFLSRRLAFAAIWHCMSNQLGYNE